LESRRATHTAYADDNDIIYHAHPSQSDVPQSKRTSADTFGFMSSRLTTRKWNWIDLA
jgi:hypothetical protein